MGWTPGRQEVTPGSSYRNGSGCQTRAGRRAAAEFEESQHALGKNGKAAQRYPVCSCSTGIPNHFFRARDYAHCSQGARSQGKPRDVPSLGGSVDESVGDRGEDLRRGQPAEGNDAAIPGLRAERREKNGDPSSYRDEAARFWSVDRTLTPPRLWSSHRGVVGGPSQACAYTTTQSTRWIRKAFVERQSSTRNGGIDLACKSWDDIGSALIGFDGLHVTEAVAGAISWPNETLTPTAAARAIDAFAREHHAAAVSMDGPHAWRDPDAPRSRPGVGRACEYETRTPGKTGSRGVAYLRPSSDGSNSALPYLLSSWNFPTSCSSMTERESWIRRRGVVARVLPHVDMAHVRAHGVTWTPKGAARRRRNVCAPCCRRLLTTSEGCDTRSRQSPGSRPQRYLPLDSSVARQKHTLVARRRARWMESGSRGSSGMHRRLVAPWRRSLHGKRRVLSSSTNVTWSLSRAWNMASRCSRGSCAGRTRARRLGSATSVSSSECTAWRSPNSVDGSGHSPMSAMRCSWQTK